MDAKRIIDEVNRNLGIYKEGLFTSTGTPENYHRTELRGELLGRSVRVEVSVEDSPGPNQFSIQLFDEEFGERLGRGNGEPNWDDAASCFQWNGALADLRKKMD